MHSEGRKAGGGMVSGMLCTENMGAGGTSCEDNIKAQEEVRLELTLSQAHPSL